MDPDRCALAFIPAGLFRPVLTGNDNLNGLSGVFLGLFIAAFPAANFLDMLLLELGAQRWRSIKRPDLPWVILNLFVLLAGLVVVVVGTNLFFSIGNRVNRLSSRIINKALWKSA